jgi:hypothetical protein
MYVSEITEKLPPHVQSSGRWSSRSVMENEKKRGASTKKGYPA